MIGFKVQRAQFQAEGSFRLFADSLSVDAVGHRLYGHATTDFDLDRARIFQDFIGGQAADDDLRRQRRDGERLLHNSSRITGALNFDPQRVFTRRETGWIEIERKGCFEIFTHECIINEETRRCCRRLLLKVERHGGDLAQFP